MSSPVPLLEQLRGTLNGAPAIVIGNGESRRSYRLAECRPEVLTFGCNVLYRDFVPHYLGAVDKIMTDEIIRQAGSGFTFVGGRRRIDQWLAASRALPGLLLTDQPADWCTGPMMVLAAAVLGCDPIFLLGFDIDWSPRPRHVNSMYRDTPRYGASDGPVSPHASSWRQHIGAVVSAFPRRHFLQIGPPTLPLPRASWERVA